jgi:hypothetical protein
MKKLLLTAILFMAVFFSNQLLAQTSQDDIQIIQGAWGKQKRELVRIAMGLSEADSVNFWPIYDEYEEKRKKLGAKRIDILNDYTKNYNKMTNGKAEELVNRIFRNDRSNSDLLHQCFFVMKKNLNAIQATKFLQIETFLQLYMKTQLQGNLPLLADLQQMKVNK